MTISYMPLWIILLPLISSIIVGILYIYSIRVSHIKDGIFAIIASTTPLISFILSLILFFEIKSRDLIFQHMFYSWVFIGDFKIDMGFLADNLSIFMAIFITFISWLIHVYSIGYMRMDKGFGKFFFYLNLFLFFMLLLVLANNPIILFIGWEGVGLCSYFLISFYYDKKLNVVSANKAFLVNRIGDFCFLFGLIILFFALSSNLGFDFLNIKSNVSQVSTHILILVGILLFVGAMGKSAQFPLYVWLPDAMAAPTPVSALIHAATMVTAGVYVISRFGFLYVQIPDVGVFIAWIGAISAIISAVIATKQNDIKKVYAYSTISQLGYMFMAVGGLFYTGAMFHVFTHAFFKALLFLLAGYLIFSTHHEQNIFKIAKNRKRSPIVYALMLIASLSISGIPPFSGFFSKDEILLSLFSSGHYCIWALGVIVAFITSYYIFRVFFVVFVSPLEDNNRMSYRLINVMIIPMILLALGSIFAGAINIPSIFGGNHFLQTWLGGDGIVLNVHTSTEIVLMILNTVVSLAGIVVAYIKFGRIKLSRLIAPSRGFIYNKFYIDEIYNFVFVRGIKKLSCWISYKIDRYVVDGIVMGIAKSIKCVGEKVSVLQDGNTVFYIYIMLAGISIVFIYMFI